MSASGAPRDPDGSVSGVERQGDIERAEHAETCGGRIQWHPESPDFGVCAECGFDDTRSEEDVLREQLLGATKALEQARDLLAEAYRDDEPDDSPGNMAFAVLNAALDALGGS